ncbi:hypothetical protein KI387_011870, partial [Taxus chinensis]
MGCVSSKVDNEEVVSRCKERRRLMKQAVNSRHQFAAAHSAYIRALKNTGNALMVFAEGESMVMNSGNIDNHVIEGNATPRTPAMVSPSQSKRRHQHHMKFQPPPPPPPLESSPSASPSVESSRMSSRHIPHILSSSEYGSPPRPPPPPPPIRPGDGISDDMWANTPSSYQGSSMWNAWEPFYPSSSPQIHRHEYKKPKQEADQMSDDRIADCMDDTNSTDYEEDEEESHFDSASRAAQPPPAPASVAGKSTGLDYPDDASSVTSWYTKDNEMQMIVARRHKDFGEIAKDLDVYFLKASDAGKQVSKLLETRRAHNEFETKKNLYHSSNVFNSLPWTWSSRPPLAIRYTLEPSIFDTSGTHGSHCSTLERLLAWEKKLYQEVRNGEARKIEQEKKLAILQNQEVRGENVIKIDKTKASIKRLQSLIMVASQAINTTSTAIVKLRESELYPQLAELSEGLMDMWRAMHECHQVQSVFAQQVKNLETMESREATSDNHRQATLQLEAEVTAWHISFCSLVISQREYIRALHGWVRLSLLQLGNEVEKEQGNRPPIYTLCEEWQQVLENIPDKVASEAIKGFVSIVHAIVVKQDEEQKHKKKAENLSKELQKKMIALRNIEQKYYSSFSLPSKRDATSDSGYEMETIDPLREKRDEIDSYRRRMEDEKINHSKSIRVTRAMTLNNIQTGLP